MVYLFLANGFETIEALAVVDMLRRAKIDVKTVGVTGKIVTSSHNIDVTADIEIDEFDVKDADAVVLPGGMPGTLNLEADKTVQGAIDYCVENKKYICTFHLKACNRQERALSIIHRHQKIREPFFSCNFSKRIVCLPYCHQKLPAKAE